MNKLLTITFIFTLLILANCEETTNAISLEVSIAVQAYLYAGETVNDIRLNSTIPLDVDSNYAPPINDAEVFLIKNDKTYQLEPSDGDSGYYHYSADDLIVESGDKFQLHIIYQDQEITAETIVPKAPTQIELSSTELKVPDFANADRSKIKEWMQNGEMSINVTWKSNSNSWFYVTLENIDENPEEIETMKFGKMGMRVFPPIHDTSYQIRQPSLTHIGNHKINVYAVNIEYANLYSSREQDSRDLQEPLTNIEGGLGVFTSFAADTAFFTVKKSS